MALIYPNMRCSLCSEPIKDGDVVVSCAHFVYAPSDPLSQQSDSGMHRRCFDAWDHREEFARRYREFWARKGREHDWPQCGTHVMPAADVFERRGPECACPACGKALYRHERTECPHCHWLRFPGDQRAGEPPAPVRAAGSRTAGTARVARTAASARPTSPSAREPDPYGTPAAHAGA